MKIQEKQTGASKVEGNKGQKRPSGDKRFAGKLEKHKPLTQKPEDPQGGVAAAIAKQQSVAPSVFQNPDAVTETTAVATPVPVQALVSEIQVRIDPHGPTEVDIEFDSRVFDGLRVNITKEGGVVAIRFSAGSDATSQFLSTHIPALSRALATKGIDVGSISVTTTADSKWKGSSKDGTGGQRKRK